MWTFDGIEPASTASSWMLALILFPVRPEAETPQQPVRGDGDCALTVSVNPMAGQRREVSTLGVIA
jgi:hypothetical protein